MTLSQRLQQNNLKIKGHLCCSEAQWSDITTRFAMREMQNMSIGAEKLWTFLVACGYAMAGYSGIERLTTILTGKDQPQPTSPRVWLEGMAVQPRIREGATHVDLALGSVRRRGASNSGIEFNNAHVSWICFCEMKWNTDISSSVTYDTKRNQLARDIENALCFQRNGSYPVSVYFAVVAPSFFESRYPVLRERFAEYNSDRSCLVTDLNECSLQKNSRVDWRCPVDMDARARNALVLRWVDFSELIDHLPESEISEEIRALWVAEGSISRESVDTDLSQEPQG